VIALASVLPNFVAFAQTTPPSEPASIALSEPTIKALQEALNKQGIAVTADGVLGDETRAAIRKYQSKHHLPVTGEADKWGQANGFGRDINLNRVKFSH